jgi:hypothetical protein
MDKIFLLKELLSNILQFKKHLIPYIYITALQNPVNSVELFHVHKQMENTKIIGISANP